MRTTALGIIFFVAAAGACKKDDDAPDLGPCVADTYEPNDARSAAASLGAVQDDDEPPIVGSKQTPLPTILKKAGTTHGAADVDWFTADVNDTGINGNPAISVIVSSTHEATAWWECTSGTTESVLCGLGDSVTGDPDFAGARGCKTKPSGASSTNVNIAIECAGTSTDSGRLTIRVRRLQPSEACERYNLTVSAE